MAAIQILQRSKFLSSPDFNSRSHNENRYTALLWQKSYFKVPFWVAMVTRHIWKDKITNTNQCEKKHISDESLKMNRLRLVCSVKQWFTFSNVEKFLWPLMNHKEVLLLKSIRKGWTSHFWRAKSILVNIFHSNIESWQNICDNWNQTVQKNNSDN